MDTRELSRGRKSPRNRVENELSLPEKSKRTGGMRGSRRDQEHPGKKRVSRNALRHGFYSKWLLVQHRDGNESPAEYDELNAAIQEHYQPVGWLEERWLETIAVWSWRLRRVIRYETGQIARALAEHSDDLQQSREADPEPDSVASSNPEMDVMTDHLFLTSEGLENQMRFEAMINRMLNHAIAELERIQTRRKEAAPVADR